MSGIGPDDEAARALAVQIGLSTKQLRFTGGADYADAPSVYAGADIFASPTYSEGFSNTILEAMACGLPVASCEVVGVTDCLRHGVNGLLTKAGDVPAHANALRQLIENDALRRSIATRGHKDCRANYSWSVVGRRVVEIYSELYGTVPVRDVPRDLTASPCRFRSHPHLL